MSLVAYASGGSSSESEEEEETPIQKVQNIPKSTGNSSNSNNFRSKAFFLQDDDEEEEDADEIPEGTPKEGEMKLDMLLPKPKSIKGDILEEIGPIPPKKIYEESEEPEVAGPSSNLFSSGHQFAKKEKGVVRISIPSLKDFENDEKDSSKKKFFEPSKKGSGLFALLPQPKNQAVVHPDSFLKKSSGPEPNPRAKFEEKKVEPPPVAQAGPSASLRPSKVKSLIPDSVRNLGKRPPASKIEEIKAKYLKQDANVRIVSNKGKKSTKDDSDDSDEEDSGGFFTLTEKNKLSEEELKALMLPEPPTENHQELPGQEYVEENVEDSNVYAQPEPVDEEMRRFLKKEEKKNKGKVQINFIDINADQLKPPPEEWIKNITDTSAIPIRKANVGGGLAKRKHQITFLAADAQAREEELKNEWARGAAKRAETRNRYGW